MKKLDYSAPVIHCRQIHTASCIMLKASLSETDFIYQGTSAPTETTLVPAGTESDIAYEHYDAWGDAKKNFSSDWE